MPQTETVTLKLPSGEMVDAVVPSGMSDTDIHGLMQQKHPEFFPKQQQRGVGAEEGSGALYNQAPSVPPMVRKMMAAKPQQSYAGAVGKVGSDLLQGVGEGALQIPLTVSRMMNKIPYAGEYLAPSAGVKAFQQVATPENTAQKIGAGLEQAGELAIGGGAMKGISSGVGALGRIGLSGGMLAADAAAHGQDVPTAAAIGGLSAGGGELAAKIAPKIAESALGTRYSERMYGRNPGQTIIDKTSGISPDAIAKSAKDVSLRMVGQLESGAQAAADRGITASTRPALDIIDRQIATATRENNANAVNALQEARKQLTERIQTGEKIPETISPKDLLDLKRGLGDTITNWGRIPERQGVSGVLKQAYHALDAEFDAAVPGSADANQAVSTLIGIGRDADRKALMPGIVQRLGGRLAAHTGAATMGALGAVEGSRRGGVEGGIVGGLAGLIAPELATSPAAGMFAARTLTNPTFTKAGVPAIVNAFMNKQRGQ